LGASRWWYRWVTVVREIIVSYRESAVMEERVHTIIFSGLDHYKKMDGMYDKLRVMQHDYKFHLSSAREMLRTGDSAGANQYLTEVEKNFTEQEMPMYCSNQVINALVNSYAERCRANDIRFDVDISAIQTLKIPDYELCVIIGNLFENAVEACERLNDNRRIKLAARSTDTQFMLMIKNSFDGAVYHVDGVPVTSKTNGGIGLRSVKAIAARYGGGTVTEWDRNMFTVFVTVDT